MGISATAIAPPAGAPGLDPGSSPLALDPSGLLGRIGGTPLFDLSRVLPEEPRRRGVRLLAKGEMTNPGGSVKDRPALAMVLDAERRGLLEPPGGAKGGAAPRRRILDATSGNTGIAYAMIGAARGHGVTLCLPANASPERRRLLAAYGAEVVLTDPLEGTDGAIRRAREMVGAEPERFAYLDQYSNPENWKAHYRTTGPEILEALEERGVQLTHFITGLGTSGTFTGVGRFLADHAPEVERISVEPDGPLHGLEGMKHMASALVPAIHDPSLAHRAWTVPTEAAYAMCRRLGRELGLLVGVSAGANVTAACRLAEELEDSELDGPAVLVTVLCDGAAKYLSEPFWSEP